MIFTTDTLTPQLTELLQHYPDLKIISQKDNEVIVSGNISVFMKHPMYILRKTYGIKIIIPLNSEELPYVVDKDSYISKSYHHYYNTGKLCLETDSAIRLRFVDGFDLVAWMTEYVETYFFSYVRNCSVLVQLSESASSVQLPELVALSRPEAQQRAAPLSSSHALSKWCQPKAACPGKHTCSCNLQGSTKHWQGNTRDAMTTFW